MVGGVYIIEVGLVPNESAGARSEFAVGSLVSAEADLFFSCGPFSSDRDSWLMVFAVGKAAALKLAERFLNRPMAIAKERRGRWCS